MKKNIEVLHLGAPLLKRLAMGLGRGSAEEAVRRPQEASPDGNLGTREFRKEVPEGSACDQRQDEEAALAGLREGLLALAQGHTDVLALSRQGEDGEVEEIQPHPFSARSAGRDGQSPKFPAQPAAWQSPSMPQEVRPLAQPVSWPAQGMQADFQSRPPVQEEIAAGGLRIYPRARRVTREGQDVLLTPKEFDILLFLARNRGEVLTKEQIYQAVWSADYLLDDSNIMAFIRKLRKKIEQNPDAPEYILTIWGVGYKFNERL